jgi:hypothetical protein
MQNEQEAPKVAETTDNNEYEAPAIEKVMTAEELTREVHYAGAPDGSALVA